MKPTKLENFINGNSQVKGAGNKSNNNNNNNNNRIVSQDNNNNGGLWNNK